MKCRAARIPLDGELLECSKEQLREYFVWYMANRTERIEMLQTLVRLESSCRAWNADLSRESLSELGRWLALSIEMRPPSIEEQGHFETHGRSCPLYGPRTGLSDVSFAYLYDVGVYLGAVLHHACPWLTWKQELRARTMFHYGHPVLAGFSGRMVFEPLHMAQVQGRKAGDGSAGPDELLKLHDAWAELAAEGRSGEKSC